MKNQTNSNLRERVHAQGLYGVLARWDDFKDEPWLEKLVLCEEEERPQSGGPPRESVSHEQETQQQRRHGVNHHVDDVVAEHRSAEGPHLESVREEMYGSVVRHITSRIADGIEHRHRVFCGQRTHVGVVCQVEEIVAEERSLERGRVDQKTDRDQCQGAQCEHRRRDRALLSRSGVAGLRTHRPSSLRSRK